MKITSKLLTGIVVFLLAGYLTLPANARLSAGGSVSYDSAGSCGESLTYVIEDRILRIQGTGDMYDYGGTSSFHYPPWDPFSFEQVVIESGVTSVGGYAFNYANGSPITSVQLPDTLRRIGTSAFSGCNNLTEIALPEGLAVIEDGAFTGCTSLKELSIPHSMTSIGWCVWTSEVRYPGMLEGTPSTWAKAEIDEAAYHYLVTHRTCKDYQQKITRIQIAELAANMVENAILDRKTKMMPEGSMIGGELFRLSEIPVSLENRFIDTNDYMVLKAYSGGIVTGRDEGVFAPDEYATREEIAVILCRAAAYVKEHSEGYAGLNMEANLSAQYADATEVSSWAGPSVAALTEAGILTGTSDTTLSPQNQTSVQEAIILTLRLYKHIVG